METIKKISTDNPLLHEISGFQTKGHGKFRPGAPSLLKRTDIKFARVERNSTSFYAPLLLVVVVFILNLGSSLGSNLPFKKNCTAAYVKRNSKEVQANFNLIKLNSVRQKSLPANILSKTNSYTNERRKNFYGKVFGVPKLVNGLIVFTWL